MSSPALGVGVRRRSLVGAALAALAAILLGCGEGEPGAGCNQTADCAAGLICFTSVCREPRDPGGNIVWRITPPQGRELAPAAFEHQGSFAELSLCPTPTVSGSLGFDGQARLVAEGALASLPGLEERYEFLVGPSFTVPLPAGAWRLTFHPEGGRPPISRSLQLARCESRRLAPIEEGPGERIALLQVVLDPERDPRPACGLFVRLNDPVSGAPLSSRLDLEPPRGSSCQERVRQILLPFRPGAAQAEVELRLGPLDARLPSFPEQRITVPLTWEDEIEELGIFAALPGGLPPQLVVVHVFDGDRSPQRRVKLTASLLQDGPGGAEEGAGGEAEPPSEASDDPPGPRASLSLRSPPAVEKAPGVYELWLLPGRYALRAEPLPLASVAIGRCASPASEFASACTDVAEIGVGSNELVMILPPKLRLHGSLRADDPWGGDRATIVAHPARGGDGREASAVADRAGAFTLWLDEGDYDLLVRPAYRQQAPLQLPLPSPLVTDTALELTLPPPALVAGKLTIATGDARGVPLRDARVQAFRLRPGRPPLFLDETLSKPDGSFALTLPAD